MPADSSLPQTPSAHHGDSSKPYPCHAWENPPIAPWSIDYGYCRHSLDSQPPHAKIGSSDPRCPRDCPHKAPGAAVMVFTRLFYTKGAKAAAEATKRHRKNKL